MLTLVETNYKHDELLKLFIEQTVKVKLQKIKVEPKYNMAVTSVNDGFVYYFDSVYVFADNNNYVAQLAVVQPNHTGVVLIDTKEVNRKHKPLLSKIEEFLSALTPMLSQMAAENIIKIDIKNNHRLHDIREEILKNNSL